MKKILAVTLVMMLGLATVGLADVFNVSLTIAPANSANFIVFKVTDPSNFPKNPIATTNLAFTTTLNTTYNTFLGNEYYAINVQPIGGAGNVNVKVNYVEGAMPSGQSSGLGSRATVAAVAVNSATNAEANLMKKSLLGSNNQTVLASALPTGNYMRFYLGLANGQEDAALGVVPFTTGDKPGTYSGTLTLTASQP